MERTEELTTEKLKRNRTSKVKTDRSCERSLLLYTIDIWVTTSQPSAQCVLLLS